jgi:type III restriction enzyme
MPATIDRLIINSPYEEPSAYWRHDRETLSFSKVEGRRPAGYVMATEGSRSFDDPGVFVPIPLVNEIRPRVKAWRERGYPGVTAVTKRLLTHWHDPEEFENRRFFFCQLEAIETLIWLTEADANERVGIEITGDGGPFRRHCCKMATGSGKTFVMAMTIAWQVLNKVANGQDGRFSKHVLVVAPGLTVKNRLAVLEPSAAGNYYERFGIVPAGEMERLRQGKVLIRNWHTLGWQSAEQIAKKRSVDKRGALSDEPYVRDVLQGAANARNWLVLNDEAHHAWRVNVVGVGKYTRTRDEKDSAEEATVWMGGLDRIARARGVMGCYDYSATPFMPSGKKSREEALFGWIVSDFGLNDAIESGLVKTPRIVVRDDAVPDARTYKSRLYHIYNDDEVKDDLNRPAQAADPLPDLVTTAYYLLGVDWRDTRRRWEEKGHAIPPVMITVANRTETAARVAHAFENRRVFIDELCEGERLLRIDSKVLKEAEEGEEPIAELGEVRESEDDDESGDEGEARPRKLTKAQQAEMLRRMVDTVGQMGQPGERIQNVVSVGMLSEGWDARTVTHIMGLRAFSSQLLCEQVIGRGLRRTSYELNAHGMFDPEYVNIFGVPFSFLPHEGGEDVVARPEILKTRVEPDPSKARYEITWPNIVRIDHAMRPELSLDYAQVEPLELNASDTPQLAELAPVVDGKPNVGQIAAIDLMRVAEEYRPQKIVFEVTRDVYEQSRPGWKGSKEVLLAQLVGIVESFLASGRVKIRPEVFARDELRRRLVLTLNMTKVVQHIWQALRFQNTERLEAVFDSLHPVRRTGEMRAWWTGRPCAGTERSYINVCVYDGAWEASDAWMLDHHDAVEAWVKNDHLGFEVLYVYRGVVRKYRPDFLVRLATGEHVIIETKGEETEEDRTRRRFLKEWVNAVNADGRFGRWRAAITRGPGEVRDVLVG